MAENLGLQFSQVMIQVDDVDPRIQYSGSWFSDSYDRPGPIQAPGELNHGTAKGTNSTASLAFIYQGFRDLAIYGTSNHVAGAETTIVCTMDGEANSMDVRIPLSPSMDAVSREPICTTKTDRDSITMGDQAMHTFVLNITTTDGNAIFVDNLALLAPINSPEDIQPGDYSEIRAGSEAVNFAGSGWQLVFSLMGNRQLTSVEGSRMSVLFYGTAATLQGYLSPLMSRIPSIATFSIDGGEETEFTLPIYSEGFRGLPSGSTRWRVPLLVTPPVPIGRHILSITHRGNASTVPLTVDSFIVAHSSTGFGSEAGSLTGVGTGTAGITVTGTRDRTPSGSTTTSTSTGLGPGATKGGSPTGGGSKSDIGLLVGIIVGVIVVFLILLVILLIYRRGQRRSRHYTATTEVFTPFDFWPLRRFCRKGVGPTASWKALPQYVAGEKLFNVEPSVVHLRYVPPSDAASHDDVTIDVDIDAFSVRPPSSTAESIPSYHSDIVVPPLDPFDISAANWKSEVVRMESEESATLPPGYTAASQ